LSAVLVVQERFRFFRDSMTVCLRRQLDGVQVTDGVTDGAALLDLAGRRPLDHALIEADGVPWDVPALVAALRGHHPGIKLIGLFRAVRPVACDGMALLPRTAAPEQILHLVQPGSDRSAPFLLTATTSSERGPLTDQQLKVLALLSLGLTTAEVAGRLSLSERGVAKSKTAIYAKLGAQSQAQAVANALAAGLLGPAGGPHPS
jgi:DNA-binding NarL/FixJ family response regulator